MDEFVEERLEWLLNSHYNLFHTKLITAALKSPAISDKDFIVGCVQIHTAELNDNDEYVPKEFQKLINTDMEYGFVEYKGKKFPTIENEIEIPFGVKDSELQEATYYIPKGFHAEIDDDKVVIKKGEKPTAWSEEDEHWRQHAVDFMKHPDIIRTVPTLAKSTIDWLKSLKQRIGG